MRALIPPLTLRKVTGNTITTGVFQSYAYVGTAQVFGAAITGAYGMNEYSWLNAGELSALLTTAFSRPDLHKGILGGTIGSDAGAAEAMSTAKVHIRTQCHSRLANTTGTGIVVDLFIFKARKSLLRGPTMSAIQNLIASIPTTGAWPTTLTLSAGGYPVELAQMLWLYSTPEGANPAEVNQMPPIWSDIDFNFTYAPLFKRFYKQVGFKSFNMSHGQSIEFRWRLPPVSCSAFELWEASNFGANGSNANDNVVANKTFFTVWRIRGAVGATASTDLDATSTTAMATANITTTRMYHIRGEPNSFMAPGRVFQSTFPFSTTQVATINEYGTGNIVNPATMA